MEFKQQIGESLTSAIGMAHTLQRGGAGIATITDALSRAGFPEKVRVTVGTLLSSELKEGYKPPIEYQQQPSYP